MLSDCQLLIFLPIQIRLFHRQAYASIARGDYAGAVMIANGLSQLPRDYATDLMIGAIRIDAGGRLHDQSEVLKGIELYERYTAKHEGKDIKEAATSSYLYNLANGYTALVEAKRDEAKRISGDDTYHYFKPTEYEDAKKYYRQALGLDPQDPSLTTQLNVNLANCLDELGRGLDALEYYEEALSITPDFGMALGNKGHCLWHYAEISGRKKIITYSEAHHLLDEALKCDLSVRDRKDFAWYKNNIERKLGPKLMQPPFAAGFVNPGMTQVERDWIQFGLDHRLYLNACNYCPGRCNAAIEDSFTLETMAPNIDDESLLKYQDWFNQIRYAYATARYLLFIAITDPYDDDSFLDRVLKADTFPHRVCDLQTELLKVCFKSFYSILDQLAFILNEYLGLGEEPVDISFNKIWYVNNQVGQEVRPAFINTYSKALNGLFNLNLDLAKDGGYIHLREMRNCIVHRFLTVADCWPEATAESLDEEELWDRTFELARITRNAIAYLMFFLWKDTKREVEQRKESAG